MRRFWQQYRWAITIMLAAVAALVLVLLILDWMGPCHEGHREMRYEAAHTTYTTVGDVRVPHFHPSTCYEVFVCDVRCNELGDLEHPEHGVIDNGLTWVDGRCK